MMVNSLVRDTSWEISFHAKFPVTVFKSSRTLPTARRTDHYYGPKRSPFPFRSHRILISKLPSVSIRDESGRSRTQTVRLASNGTPFCPGHCTIITKYSIERAHISQIFLIRDITNSSTFGSVRKSNS